MTNDELYMNRCFQLARNGFGHVAPNPMVGCVIVKDGTIVSEGFHQCCGQNHAERNAILRVSDISLLAGSTLYVNLEPCSHHGKTPPCTDLIINHGIKRVVVSNDDSNLLVAGKGYQKLYDAGIEVVRGVLEEEGYFLNRRFFTFIEKQRPYIILKWAQTQDGFMDVKRRNCDPVNYWITNDFLKREVHKWRTEESGIMVGTQTIVNDDPMLTTRLWYGKNPIRITLDKTGRIPQKSHLLDGSVPTLVYTENKALKSTENIIYVPICFDNLIPELLYDLFQREIQSIFIEGGFHLLNTFIVKNIWDEARVLTGNKYFLTGLSAPSLLIEPSSSEQNYSDSVSYYYNF